MLYNAMVTPHFDLGNTVYVVAAHYQLNRLQVIQNTAARLILLADARCTVYDLHKQLGWDTLSTRSSKAFTRIIYCCIHNKEPAYLYECLVPTHHPGRVTRATEAGKLDVPRVRTNMGKLGFRYRAPTVWNTTKDEIKAAVNVNQLENILKTSWYE